MKEFTFRPANWLPNAQQPEMLECVRNIRREDMEYTNEAGFSVRIVLNPTLIMVQHMFHHIYLSDVNNTPFTMICPNQWPDAYSSVAEMINRFNVSCRNVHAFAMDEWADEDGNVAPLTYGAGLGYSFINHFYAKIRKELRPPVEQWHVHSNDTRETNAYSHLIEDVGGGGADVVYSATGWPGHTAFIEPGAPEFYAATLGEYLTLGSRLITQNPLTICENSLFSPMGASGDVWAVPPRAITIGPRDIANSRERFEMHNICSVGGDSWQRMISRIELYGPISMECPASIMRLGRGTCYVSEAIAKPITGWKCGIETWEM